MSLWNELKRRNVIRVAAAYVVTSWLIIQVAETVLPLYGIADSSIRLVVTALAVLFVPTVVLAWVFEWTPTGIRKDADSDRSAATSAANYRQFDRVLIVVLAIAVTYFAVDKFIIELEPAHPSEQSIAVIPFANLSADPEQAYLALGVAEEVRNLLAKISLLRVISRTAIATVLETNPDTVKLAATLNVRHVLEGSVQSAGNRIRITAQLIDVQSDTQLWSETYDRTLDDIFTIQDDIAESIVENLRLELMGPIPRASRTDPRALDNLIRAKQVWYQEIKQGNWTGIGEQMDVYLDAALDIDPGYVEALSWRAQSTFAHAVAGDISPEEYNRRNEYIAQSVRNIDPDHAFPYWDQAWRLTYFDVDFAAAAPVWEQVYQRTRNNAEILRDVARFASYIERFDISTQVYERSIAVDPLCTRCLYHLSRNYMYAGDWEKAEEARERFMLISDGGGSFFYGIIKLMLGDAERALEIFHESETGPDKPGSVMALYALGRYEESDQALARLIEEVGEGEPRVLAEVHAFRNEKDASFGWLEKLLQQPPNPIYGKFELIDTVVSPMLHNLHDDPRWEQFRVRVGVPTELIRALQFSIDTPT